MNIVSMGMKFLGPTVVTKVASMLGINNTMVTSLIGAALPTVLAGLTGKASSEGGANALMGLLGQQQVDSPEAFEAALADADPNEMAQSGGSMLSGLLGGDATNALAGALGQHAGVDQGNASSLLGLIAPAAMGALKGEVSSGGLDASGLASLLEGQKDNITAAMPAGFADRLAGTGLLDSIQPPAQPAVATPAPAPAPAAAPATAPGGGGLLKIIAPVVLVAGLGWYFFGQSPSLPEVPEMPDLASMAEGVDLSVGDVDLGSEFGTVISDLTGSLGGITDTASAEAALPELEAAGDQLGALGELAGELPEEAQGVFGSIVGSALGTIRPMIESAIAGSGAGSILQPVADTILGALEGMAG